MTGVCEDEMVLGGGGEEKKGNGSRWMVWVGGWDMIREASEKGEKVKNRAEGVRRRRAGNGDGDGGVGRRERGKVAQP